MESGEWRRQQLQERQGLLRERVEALRVDQLQEQEELLFNQVAKLRSDVEQQQKQAAELRKQVEQLVMDQRRHCEKVEAHLGVIFHRVERGQANRLLEQLERLRDELGQVEQLKVEWLRPRAEELNRLVAQQMQQTEQLISEHARLHQQLGSRVPHAFRSNRREQVRQNLQQLELEVEQLQQKVSRLEPKVQQQQELVTQQ